MIRKQLLENYKRNVMLKIYLIFIAAFSCFHPDFIGIFLFLSFPGHMS